MPSRTLLLLAPISVAIPLLATLSLAPPVARQAAPPVAPKRVANNAAEELLDRVEASRFGAAKDAGKGTMRLRGRVSCALPGRTSEKPLAGDVDIVFDGERMSERLDFGSQGASAQVFDGKLFWGVHPLFGKRIYRGVEERTMLRVYGIVRGAPWRTLYTSAEKVRDERQDGKTRTIVRLFDGAEDDTWVIDVDKLRVVRIEMVMHDCSTKEDKKTQSKLEYDDWRPVSGISFPFIERFSMEGATGETLYQSIERGIEVDPKLFETPAEIRELNAKETADGSVVVDLPAPQVVQCEEQPVASIRVKIKADQVHRTLAQLLPEVMSWLTETGASASGPPFARFHGEGEGEVDFEAGVPVAAPITAHDRVKPSTLPGGRTIMTWYSGAYSELAEARTRLAKTVAEMHLKPRGGAWIYYWTDPTVERDKSRRRSQIVQPIE